MNGIGDTRAEKRALGLTLTCVGEPSLNATYSVQAGDQLSMQALVLYILVNNTFPAGQATWQWPDASGERHAFTVAQFKAFASAVADYVAGIELQLRQPSPNWPTASATIP